MIVVRQVTSDDLTQWVALRLLLWPDQGVAGLSRDAAAYFASTNTGPGVMPEVVFVAHDENSAALLGFAEISRRLYAEGCSTSPVGFLEGWFVVEGRRQEGIGGALVAAAERWARAAGCSELASDALADNALSATAHQALGFEEVEVIRCFRKSIHTP